MPERCGRNPGVPITKSSAQERRTVRDEDRPQKQFEGTHPGQVRLHPCAAPTVHPLSVRTRFRRMPDASNWSTRASTALIGELPADEASPSPSTDSRTTSRGWPAASTCTSQDQRARRSERDRPIAAAAPRRQPAQRPESVVHADVSQRLADPFRTPDARRSHNTTLAPPPSSAATSPCRPVEDRHLRRLESLVRFGQSIATRRGDRLRSGTRCRVAVRRRGTTLHPKEALCPK